MVSPRHLRLALPFTILTGPDTVQLAAGEDFRYTLTGPDLDGWLPGFLTGLDGRTPLDEMLGRLPEARRGTARQLVERLSGERVLIDGTASDAHSPQHYRVALEGSAAWAAAWQLHTEPPHPALSPEGRGQGEGRVLPVLCQDRLDYEEALRCNRRCLDTSTPWLWASTGPMSRAYISPLFLPDAGPCLSCLLYHFRRLSPVPDLYDALTAHVRAGGAVASVPFPPLAVAIVRQLLLWKAALAEEAETHPALYQLQVLEVAQLEVTSHLVFVDPECPECGGRS